MTLKFKTTWRGKKLIGKTAKEAERALRIGAEVLLQKSKETVPHDKGILENSGSVDSQINPPTATTFYDTPYAERLHEHPEFDFKGKGEGKWLENALDENEKTINKAIQKAMKGAFK